MCPPERAIIREMRYLLDDVDKLKRQIELVEKCFNIEFFWSTDDRDWKIRKDGEIISFPNKDKL